VSPLEAMGTAMGGSSRFNSVFWRRLVGSIQPALLAGGLVWAGSVAAAPVVRPLEDGQVNWSTREVQVNGVGTPVILSHTGGTTPRDPYEQARDDARQRLQRALGALPVDARPAGTVQALDAILASALQSFQSDPPLHFSDGTVHLRSTASFAWGAALAGPPIPQAPDAPTGLLVRLTGPMEPRMRLTLMAAGAPAVVAGLPGDVIGGAGVVWVARGDEGTLTGLLGPRPIETAATPGKAGELVLDAAGAAVLQHAGGLQGAVAVVMP